MCLSKWRPSFTGPWHWSEGREGSSRQNAHSSRASERGRLPFLLVWGSKAYCQKSLSRQRPKAEEGTHPPGKKEPATQRLLILKKMMGKRGQREISSGNRSRGTGTGNSESLCPRTVIEELACSSQQIRADTMVTRKTTTSVSDGSKDCEDLSVPRTTGTQSLSRAGWPSWRVTLQLSLQQPAKMSRKLVENWLQAYTAYLKQ